MGSTCFITGILACVFLLSAAGAFSTVEVDSDLMGSGAYGSGISRFGSQLPQLAKRNNKPVCGKRLVETIRALCRGRYYSGFSRRSDPAIIPDIHAEDSQGFHYESNNAIDVGSSDSTVNTLYDMQNSNSNFELLWPENSKLLAFNVLSEGNEHQRVRRNVIEECCYRVCSIQQMLRYCGK